MAFLVGVFLAAGNMLQLSPAEETWPGRRTNDIKRDNVAKLFLKGWVDQCLLQYFLFIENIQKKLAFAIRLQTVLLC